MKLNSGFPKWHSGKVCLKLRSQPIHSINERVSYSLASSPSSRLGVVPVSMFETFIDVYMCHSMKITFLALRDIWICIDIPSWNSDVNFFYPYSTLKYLRLEVKLLKSYHIWTICHWTFIKQEQSIDLILKKYAALLFNLWLRYTLKYLFL